jgi:hypothetical protein
LYPAFYPAKSFGFVTFLLLHFAGLLHLPKTRRQENQKKKLPLLSVSAAVLSETTQERKRDQSEHKKTFVVELS